MIKRNRKKLTIEFLKIANVNAEKMVKIKISRMMSKIGICSEIFWETVNELEGKRYIRMIHYQRRKYDKEYRTPIITPLGKLFLFELMQDKEKNK